MIIKLRDNACSNLPSRKIRRSGDMGDVMHHDNTSREERREMRGWRREMKERREEGNCLVDWGGSECDNGGVWAARLCVIGPPAPSALIDKDRCLCGCARMLHVLLFGKVVLIMTGPR